MSALPVDVSTAPGATFSLVVDAVDFELRLAEDVGLGQTLIFDASKGERGKTCPLLLEADYLLRYNNNDGGIGRLHFRIVETGAGQVVRREVNLGAIFTPIVLEFQIRLQTNAGLIPA